MPPAPHEPKPSLSPVCPDHPIRVVRVALPTPDAAMIVDHGRIVVLADPRVGDEQVERLRQAAAYMLTLIPEPREP